MKLRYPKHVNAADLVAMRRMIGAVERFHKAANIVTPNKPCIPPPDRVQLRKNLCDEEYIREFRQGLEDGNLQEIYDGGLDIIFVVLGTFLEYGLHRIAPAGWAVVSASNDDKIDPATGKCILREDGKVLKPHGWESPVPELKLLLDQAAKADWFWT